MDVYDIGKRRELFLDDYLTESHAGMQFELCKPTEHDYEPGQPSGNYMTMIQDGPFVHCYYRRNYDEFTGADSPYTVKPGYVNEFTAYARSAKGVKFQEPPLFIHDCGVPNVLKTMENCVHNFTPFIDDNPKCPPEQRYKALGGVCETGGLLGFASPDATGFKQLQAEPVIPARKEWEYCMDSQNVSFWSECEGCYVCYFRINKTPDGRKLRTIAKCTSQDFIHWNEPEFLNPNKEKEHLYVSLLKPYYRAKHIYIGTPTRYFEERGSATDIAFFYSREGRGISRPYDGAWIEPGTDPERWKNRANYMAYGTVQTSPVEMSLYHSRSKHRYSLRIDGFTRLFTRTTGEWLSKPITVPGGKLELNVATSAAGSIRVEIQDMQGHPLPGYSLDDCELFYGDAISYMPKWKGTPSDIPAGTPVRIRCECCECSLYSFCFV